MTNKIIKINLILMVMLGVSIGICEASNKVIRIGYLQADIHQLACWVAIDEGLYKKEGITVKVAGIFRAGPEEMSAFAADSLDMGYVGEAPATVAVANGVAKVTVVAQVNTEGSALVVGKSSNINNVSELAGKLFAIPGHSTVQDFLLKKGLTKNKVPLNQVKLIVVKPPEMINALRENQVAGFVAWEPYPAKAQTMGVGKVLVKSGKIWPEHPCCVLVVQDAFLKSRLDEVKAMVRAHIKATEFINNNPSQALKIGMKYTGMDANTVKLAMENVKYTYNISIEGEKEYVEKLNKLGYIKVPNTDRFCEIFLNTKIISEYHK